MPSYLVFSAAGGTTPLRPTGADIAKPSLVQQYILIRTIQRERRYFNIKPHAALTLHLVSPAHHSRRRVEGRATRIFIALARLDTRLFPNTTRPLDLGQFATCVRDHPVPAQQLHRFPSLVLDDHSISPEILRAAWR